MRREDLPELGVVKTATPCKASWDQMVGDDVRRFCGKCELYVYDVSALTADEARELLNSTEGRICARIFTRADGTVLTKDCPTGVAAGRRKRFGGMAAAAAVVGGVAAAAVSALSTPASCPTNPPTNIVSKNPRGDMLMGKVSYVPPTQVKK